LIFPVLLFVADTATTLTESHESAAAAILLTPQTIRDASASVGSRPSGVS
jgi:hypothetical protein